MIRNEQKLAQGHQKLVELCTALAEAAAKDLGMDLWVERCGENPVAIKALEAQGRLPMRDVNRLRTHAGMAPIGPAENTLSIPSGIVDKYAPAKGKATAVDVLLAPSGSNACTPWPMILPRWEKLVQGVLKEATGIEWGGAGFPGHFALGKGK